MSSLVPEFPAAEAQDALGALMLHILDTINSVFEQAGTSLPGRQYITVGEEVHDCEQLTVSFRQMYPGPVGAQSETPQQCDSPRTAVITVQLVRKIILPQGGRQGTIAPDPMRITDRTLERMVDAWLLMDASMTATDQYLGGIIADVAVTNPQGEFQAIVLNISAGVP